MEQDNKMPHTGNTLGHILTLINVSGHILKTQPPNTVMAIMCDDEKHAYLVAYGTELRYQWTQNGKWEVLPK